MTLAAKLFSINDEPLDDRINAWIDGRDDIVIMNIVPLSYLSVLIFYETIYDAQSGKKKKKNKDRDQEKSLKQPKPKVLSPLPLKKGATSPTWEATMKDSHGVRPAPVMAGVFPVPEGFKLHPDDANLAPPVLLAKGADLSKYADLFGNIKGHES